MDEDTKKGILDAFLKSSGGRRRLASTMIQPLQATRDYTSVGRKTFLVGDLGFRCRKCGYTHPDAKYVHSDDECVVAEVILT